MKRILVLVLAIPFLLSACGAEKGIEVQEAWARPAAQGENGAIYFVIRNHAREIDILTGVSSEMAEAVEIHMSKMDGDVMQMHQLDSIVLDAGGEFTFAPGGLHIMLVRLKKELKVGDAVEIILHFQNSEDMNLQVPVREKEQE